MSRNWDGGSTRAWRIVPPAAAEETPAGSSEPSVPSDAGPEQGGSADEPTDETLFSDEENVSGPADGQNVSAAHGTSDGTDMSAGVSSAPPPWRPTHRCTTCGVEWVPPRLVASYPHTGCGGIWQPIEVER